MILSNNTKLIVIFFCQNGGLIEISANTTPKIVITL
jgi:hypothetical protein